MSASQILGCDRGTYGGRKKEPRVKAAKTLRQRRERKWQGIGSAASLVN